MKKILTKLHLRHVAAELLSQRERRGVLRVCPADLDDVRVLFGFRVERIVKLFHAGQERVVDLDGDGDVHGRRVRVVGALRTSVLFYRELHGC